MNSVLCQRSPSSRIATATVPTLIIDVSGESYPLAVCDDMLKTHRKQRELMTQESTNNQPQNALDGSPCLQGERLSFTGTLASMTHQQAHELVTQHGGEATQHVSKQTTMLVVGEEGWPLEDNGHPSQKLQQVTEWRVQGLHIKLINESEWLYLLGLHNRQQEVHRLYTPAMLSQLLSLSVNVIRRWERLGLIKAVRRVFRLPYFDFQEVASVRRLAELMDAGVSRHELEVSLSKLKDVMRDIDRPLAQLQILARDAHVLYRDERGIIEPISGQRLMEFDPVETQPAEAVAIGDSIVSAAESESQHQQNWTYQNWLDQGSRLLEENQPQPAAEAFRLCLMDRPDEPEVHFNLADCLYRNGNLLGALERFHIAVELDHNYIEAWTQLGCIQEQLGDTQAALDAFGIALEAHPDFPEANFHKAQLLDQLGRADEAISLWETYLKFDSRGPWAETARQRLASASFEQNE